MEKDVIVFILEVGLLLQVSVSGCRSGAVVVVCGGGSGDYGWLVDGARLGVVGTRAGLVHVFGEDLVEKAAVDLVLLDADVVLKTGKISSLLEKRFLAILSTKLKIFSIANPKNFTKSIVFRFFEFFKFIIFIYDWICLVLF